MDSLIHSIAKATNFTKALAVTVGGLLGVFATLALFFVIILVADKVAGRKKA